MRGLGGEVFAHHPGRRGLPRGGEWAPNRRDFGPGKPRIDPKSTPNSPIPTQIGPGLARKSPGSARVWSGGMWGGVFVRGRCWGMSCWSEGKFWAVEFLLHAVSLFYLGSFFQVPTPCPLPLLQLVRERALPQREGEYYSIHLISKGHV